MLTFEEFKLKGKGDGISWTGHRLSQCEIINGRYAEVDYCSQYDDGEVVKEEEWAAFYKAYTEDLDS